MVCGVAVAVCLACVVARAWRTQGGKLLEGKQHLVDSISGPAAVDELEYHYDAYDAWLGAGTFMSVCFVISWAAGVLEATFFHPTWPSLANVYFIAFTAASFAIVIIGYWIIWPKGTVSYGRKWGWHCVLFGIFDGLAESQLFLCIWSAVELIGLPRYGTGLVTFVLQGGFKANWDHLFFDLFYFSSSNLHKKTSFLLEERFVILEIPIIH